MNNNYLELLKIEAKRLESINESDMTELEQLLLNDVSREIELEESKIENTKLFIKLKKFVLKHFNLDDHDLVHLDGILKLMVQELKDTYEDEQVSEYVLYDMFDDKYMEYQKQN